MKLGIGFVAALEAAGKVDTEEANVMVLETASGSEVNTVDTDELASSDVEKIPMVVGPETL